MTRLFVLPLCLTLYLSGSVVTAQSLTTFYGSDNGLGGFSAVAFDLTVGNADITITGFDTNTSMTTFFDMNVFMSTGTYVGNENDLGFWGSPVATGNAIGAGTDNPTSVTLNTDLLLNANTTYAIALEMGPGGDHQYTIGDGTNENFSNSDLSLSLGSGISLFGTTFSGVFNPRVWNGTVYYSVSSVPEPGSVCALIAAGVVFLTRRRRNFAV